ncbi:hypothetical protein Hte_007887 [Hypoxylon texense]
MLPIISLVGAVSSGKSALGRKLAEEFRLYYLSVGDFFRSISEVPLPRLLEDLIEKGHKKGEYVSMEEFRRTNIPGIHTNVYIAAYIRQYVVSRDTIPYTVAIPLLENMVREIDDDVVNRHKYKGILLDGFPRTLDHLERAKTIRYSIRLAIFIHLPAEDARSRFLRRSKSDEDTVAYEHRLQSFYENISDLLGEFQSKGQLLGFVNDNSRTVDQAYEDLVQNLSPNEQWKAIVGPTYLPLF